MSKINNESSTVAESSAIAIATATGLPSNSDHIPLVYKLPTIDSNEQKKIIKTNINPELKKIINYPKFSLGFHHFFQQSRAKMDAIVSQFEGKKPVYNILSMFEKTIDDSDRDLATISKSYFNVEHIISRSFYIAWEIISLFGVPDSNNFVSAHLSETPGSFVQATILFREKFYKNSSKDKYYVISSDLNDSGIGLDEKFISSYSKDKRVNIHETFPPTEANKSSSKDDGNFSNLKTIKNFTKKFGQNKANLITAITGGIKFEKIDILEQHTSLIVLGQIITALKIQQDNGNFILKIFESFTQLTTKFMVILSCFYNDVYIVKPLTSRKYVSEKYIVCIGFKNFTGSDKFIKTLEDALELSSPQNGQNFLTDLFPAYIPPKEYISTIISSNLEISNKQFQNINEIVNFVNKENYRGDEYQKRRRSQIDATEFWTNKFFTKNYVHMSDYLKQIVESKSKIINNFTNRLD